MSEKQKLPEWTRSARRLDRPQIDDWYTPERGDLEGVIVWQGTFNSDNGPFRVSAVRRADGSVTGVRERAGLKLSDTPVGTRILVHPTGTRQLSGGRTMHAYEVYAESPGGSPERDTPPF